MLRIGSVRLETDSKTWQDETREGQRLIQLHVLGSVLHVDRISDWRQTLQYVREGTGSRPSARIADAAFRKNAHCAASLTRGDLDVEAADNVITYHSAFTLKTQNQA